MMAFPHMVVPRTEDEARADADTARLWRLFYRSWERCAGAIIETKEEVAVYAPTPEIAYWRARQGHAGSRGSEMMTFCRSHHPGLPHDIEHRLFLAAAP